jgi:site-specific DNA recombinase
MALKTDAMVQPKAVLYLRVSTEEQVANYSLSTQEEICIKEARQRGLEVDIIFREEGRSAKTINGRPELLTLLDYCRKHKKEVRAVIVYRLDRISRQASDYLTIRARLAEYGINVVSATEPTGNSPTEKLIETMLAGFAQLDNDVRGERARNGMKARFKTGLISSKAPLGYLNRDGYVIKDPETFDHIKASWEMMATGTKSMTDIADFLASKGVTNIRNGRNYPIYKQSISRIFHNKFYYGLITSKKYKTETQGQHPAMISEEHFYAVQTVINGHDTNRSIITPVRMKSREEFPLRRLIYCGVCGLPLTSAFSKGRHARYAYYFCPNRCGRPSSINPLTLDEQVDKILSSVIPTQIGLDKFLIALRKKYASRIGESQKTSEEKIAKIDGLKQMRQTVIEKNLEGVYSDTVLQEQLAILDERLADAHEAKSRASIQQYNLEEITVFIAEKLSNIRSTYETSNAHQRKALLGSIYPSGMQWLYPGLSNHGISPLYQLILTPEDTMVSFGEPDRTRTCDALLKRETLYR